jgi:hypothetical protein
MLLPHIAVDVVVLLTDDEELELLPGSGSVHAHSS